MLMKSFAFLTTAALAYDVPMLRSSQRGEAGLALQRIAEENSVPARELLALFEGDIVPELTTISENYGEDFAQQLVDEGLIDPNSSRGIDVTGRWNARVNDVVEIPYTIDGSYFDEVAQRKINGAINELSNRMKVVKFVNRTSEADYIKVVESDGCASWIGKINTSPQEVWLNNPDCLYTGVIQHEFMHALGIWHEQSRPDRDTYVKINVENIREDSTSAFEIRSNAQSLGSAYDYDSLMHYGPKTFSKNGEDTITPLSGATIGQRNTASDEDIVQIQLLYQCVSEARTKAAAANSPCSKDCKCWADSTGCGNDGDDACQGDLVCSNNQCVAATAPNPTSAAPTQPPQGPTPASNPTRSPTRQPALPTGPTVVTGGGTSPASCFSENNFVHVRGKGTMPMSHLQVGDFVKTCAEGEFSEVYSFFHKHTEMTTSYISITTTNGAKLEISKDHMMHSKRGVVRAAEVREGDQLPGSGVVESVQTVTRKGLYAPITKRGSLDVSGVCVSSYVALWDYLPWIQNAVTHLSMSVFRMGCDLMSCEKETYDEETGFAAKYVGLIDFITRVQVMGRAAQLAVTAVGAPFVSVLFVFENTLFEYPIAFISAMCGCYVCATMNTKNAKRP